MWKRVCNGCKNDLEIDLKRALKIKQFSVIYYKDGRFNLEYKNNSQELVFCENCAKTYTIADLWFMIQNVDHKSKVESDEPEA
jgi:hypothetical protein